jgi:SNF2 family DNA or RNA helicase
MICNPKLVETGLDLLGFPTVVFYQCGYSIYTLRQASRRSWRITQKEPVQVYYLTYAGTMQTRAMKLIASKLETSLAIEGELTDKGLAALAETSDSMTKQLAKALLEQADDGESLKDVWTAFRKKELEMEGHGGGSGPLAPEVEKKQVEVEQIGDRVLKVAFTRFIGRRKATTEIEVKPGELEQMMKGKTGGAQLLLF